MPKRFWLVPFSILSGVWLYRSLRQGSLEQCTANLRAFDMPTAALYDAFWGELFTGFYDQVAKEVASACPTGLVLEAGSGPGRLAVRLAQMAAGVTVTGVDLTPAMVEMATRRAAEAGLSGRVRFEACNVAALPFPDQHFDAVVSTFAFHHFDDPARALAEIYRVLKPGGTAWIYDVPDWLARAAHHWVPLARLATASPFGGGTVEKTHWWGLVHAGNRLRLQRRSESTTNPLSPEQISPHPTRTASERSNRHGREAGRQRG